MQPQFDFFRSENKPNLFIGSKMFYVHALNSEHAQYALWFCVNAYWLEWTKHVHWGMFCAHTYCYY